MNENLTSGIHWGVVESRDSDPLMLGRCKVRILGLHSESKLDLPTKDLPWAYPMMPVHSASMNGIGLSPTGVVEGTWCALVFRDADKQHPIIIGTVGGIPEPIKPTTNTPTSIPQVPLNAVRSGDGSVVVDGSGNPVTSGEAPVYATAPDESAAPTGNMLKPGGLTVSARGLAEIRSSEAISSLVQGQNKFTRAVLDPATPLYPYKDTKGIWTIGIGSTYLADGSRVNENTRINAGQAEALFKAHIQKEVEIPLNKKLSAPVTQEMFDAMASISYNMGVYGFMGSSVFTNVNTGNYAVAAAQIPNLATGGGNGPRRAREAEYFKSGGMPAGNTGVVPPSSIPKTTTTTPTTSGGTSGTSGNTTTSSADDNVGFRDPNKKYPLEDWAYEQDTHRLARNEAIDKTVVFSKEAARAVDIHCAGDAWNQPHVPYNARYPHNHTKVTEAGHLEEWDDSPGNERIQTYHAKGTYEEVDRDGTRIIRVVGDNYEIIERNGKVLIKGDSYVTVYGTTRLEVKGSAYIKVFGSAITQTEGDHSHYVKGNYIVKADGAINFEAGGEFTGRAGGNVGFDGADTYLQSGVAGPANITEIIDIDISDTPPPKWNTLAEADRIQEIKALFDSPDQGSNTAYLDEQVALGNLDSSEIEAKTETVDSAEPVSTPIVTPPPDTCGNLKQPFSASTQLSKNFTLGKFTQHSTPPNGIPLVPQQGLSVAEIVCNMKYLADNVAEYVYAKYPNMYISSSFRSVAGNAAAGGVSKSDHMTGSAIDIKFQGFGPQEVYDAAIEIQKTLPAYHQIILEYSGSSMWLHVALRRNGNNAHQVLTMDVGRPSKTILNKLVLLR